MAFCGNAAGDPDWIVLDRMEIGASPGRTRIHVSANSYSSSIQPMLDSHRNAAPESAYIVLVGVEVTSLDIVAGNYLKSGERTFLKIDTQCFEHQFLAGAEALLPHIHGVQIGL
jgi:FkbM family methyltransferase